MGATAFVIVGFSKCGTTALLHGMRSISGVSFDTRDGQVEAAFLNSDTGAAELAAVDGRRSKTPGLPGHKYSNYIQNERVLMRLAAMPSRPLVIVCVRHPLRALISWHAMHQQIAIQGAPRSHFACATEDARTFYATATLQDYYKHFAMRRLNFGARLSSLRSIVRDNRVLIVSQERLAADKAEVLRRIAGLLGSTAEAASTPRHVSHAESIDITAVPVHIQRELHARRNALWLALRECAPDQRFEMLM